MTSDKALADQLVAKGILTKRHLVGDKYVKSYTLQAIQPVHLDHYFIGRELLGGADNAVRDWRVYGALYEKMNADADVRQMIEDLINA